MSSFVSAKNVMWKLLHSHSGSQVKVGWIRFWNEYYLLIFSCEQVFESWSKVDHVVMNSVSFIYVEMITDGLFRRTCPGAYGVRCIVKVSFV